jgi:hypothetical protein
MTLEATFSHACCRIFSPNASWSVAACGTGKTSEVMEILQKWDQMRKNMIKNPMIFGIYLFFYSFIYSFIDLFIYLFICIQCVCV